jgi:hypothetical protein
VGCNDICEIRARFGEAKNTAVKSTLYEQKAPNALHAAAVFVRPRACLRDEPGQF